MLDTFSRQIVDWCIDTTQDLNLVISALDMAIKNRNPPAGGIVHADHRIQFSSWAFTHEIRAAGSMPAFGTVGDERHNAMTGSFWSSIKIKSLNCKKWRTRIDLANAIFEYIRLSRPGSDGGSRST